MQTSSSAALLPSLPHAGGAGLPSQPPPSGAVEENNQLSLQASLSSPNLMQHLREHSAQRKAAANRLVDSFHSHHVHYI